MPLYLGNEQISNVSIAFDGSGSTSGIDTSNATATANDIASGVTAYVNGEKITGTVDTVSSGSIKGSSFHSVSFNSSNNSILVEGKMSANTLYRSGSYSQVYIPGTTFGAADSENVMAGKTFTSLYGLKKTGTLVVQKYYTGSSEPSSSLGNDGDIYLKA